MSVLHIDKSNSIYVKITITGEFTTVQFLKVDVTVIIYDL